jgi:hypothetical protein
MPAIVTIGYMQFAFHKVELAATVMMAMNEAMSVEGYKEFKRSKREPELSMRIVEAIKWERPEEEADSSSAEDQTAP